MIQPGGSVRDEEVIAAVDAAGAAMVATGRAALQALSAPRRQRSWLALGEYGALVFDHVTIRVADLAASERFYRTTLEQLGIEPNHVEETWVEWEDFAIVAADEDHPPTRNLHIGSSHPRASMWGRSGAPASVPEPQDDGEPGERPQYTDSYYGAFLRDPDRNSAEAVIHSDVRRGGYIDHLWIRVRDLDLASAFYETVARHTGLREGRRWEQGRQFRGAWATFSLVADGTPPTANLHIAFPAPDAQTVVDFHRSATLAGYRDNGFPGERAHYHPGYYGAFVLDPDGTNVESVFHQRS